MQLRRFLRDRRGVAAVEFALMAPTMLLLYYGMVEGTQALLANRRSAAVTTAIGDLVSQSAQVSSADLENIFDAGTTLMKPFPVADLGIRVTSIKIQPDGSPLFDWSKARGTVDGDPKNVADVSKDLRTNGAVLRAETQFVFKTPFEKFLPKTVTFRHKMDFSPRPGAPIVLLN